MNISISQSNLKFNIEESSTINSVNERRISDLSDKNMQHILNVINYATLANNWDSYGSNRPDAMAIQKALNFIVYRLHPLNKNVFFTAPTADGDILVEVKEGEASLEFIFSSHVEDKIIAIAEDEVKSDAILNETTFGAYLKWLING